MMIDMARLPMKITYCSMTYGASLTIDIKNLALTQAAQFSAIYNWESVTDVRNVCYARRLLGTQCHPERGPGLWLSIVRFVFPEHDVDKIDSKANQAAERAP